MLSFLLQRRYEALKEIRDNMNAIHHVYSQGEMKHFDIPLEEYAKEFDEKLAGFLRAGDEWAIVLSREFIEFTSLHYWMYQGLRYKEPSQAIGYKYFMGHKQNHLMIYVG
ncbi:MAG TPA: hypothetical protein EYO39_00270 [Nitrospirales bacterium]|nr:hypothetical protein [Nitrospirales bacterium]